MRLEMSLFALCLLAIAVLLALLCGCPGRGGVGQPCPSTPGATDTGPGPRGTGCEVRR